MAFATYKTIESVITTHQVRYVEESFIEEIPLEIPEFFRQDLQIVMRDGVTDSSEFAICENLIYPVLKQVWKGYRDLFILWSHHSLTYDKDLYGFPEYILASRSPLGKVVFAQPYLLLVEAKQDDFEQAWGQCIAVCGSAPIESLGRIFRSARVREAEGCDRISSAELPVSGRVLI